MNDLLLYLGGALTIVWGTADLFPTSKVVQGFGPITRDNRRILTMEWVAEAILLIFTGVLIVVMTARFSAGGTATQTAAAVSAMMLLVLAGRVISDWRTGRLHHVSPVRADLRPLGGAAPDRRFRVAPIAYGIRPPPADS